MFSLIGHGSHGRDILAIAKRCGIGGIAVFDDNTNIAPAPPGDLYGHVIFGSNYPKQRREMAERFVNASPAHPLIDPSAIIDPHCRIAAGSVIAPFALLLTGVTLGHHVHVNYHASMTRCRVGDYTTISPGATICGDVVIGNECLIGANATVADRCTIGDGATIAAGAIVPPTSHVPAGVTVIGVYKT